MKVPEDSAMAVAIKEAVPDKPICIRFVNTVENYRLEKRLDYFETYSVVLEWAEAVGLISPGQAGGIRDLIEPQPGRAERELERTKQVRELLYRVIRAAARGETPVRDDIDEFNRMLREALPHQQVVAGDDGYTWTTYREDATPEAILWPIVRSTAELLTSPEVDRLRQCGGEHCTWMFIDRSKNRSRRWCEMQVCGNRAKSKRHYARKRAEAE